MRVEFTPAARRDIEKIWRHSFEQFGLGQAEVYLRDIQHAAQTVADDPRRGRPCDDIRAGYRKLAVGSHVLFFRVVDETVIVVRILHQRMDFERHLK